MKARLVNLLLFAVDFGLPYIGILVMVYYFSKVNCGTARADLAVDAITGYALGYGAKLIIDGLLSVFEPKDTRGQGGANQYR